MTSSPPSQRGRLITFEGIEGSGKSTQQSMLAERLKKEGDDPLVTREPGGTRVGVPIRNIFLDPNIEGMAPMTELMLLNADRAQHVAEVIRPALEAGRVVLCDRYVDSTRAYQGGGRALGMPLVDEIHKTSTGDLWPDRTYWLALEVGVGLERAAKRRMGVADRIENDTLHFHQIIGGAFEEIHLREPDRFIRIDGSLTQEKAHEAIWEDFCRFRQAER